MIEFRLLGTLQLTDAEGREVTSLLTRSRRLALLAYLAAATPRGLHRRDTLLALFWPELDQEHARAALRQALHVLRSALGGVVIVTRGDEEIGLDFDAVHCDVVEFDRAVAAGRPREALDLYRGALLEGFFISGAPDFERWQDLERARLQEAACRGAQALGDDAEARGDLAGAATWRRRNMQLAPHDEQPLRRLMTLLDRVGDRAGAVAAYDEFAERLRADLETEPAAETKALLSAVRARDQAAPVVRWSAASGAPLSRPRRTWRPALIVIGLASLLLAVSLGSWRGRLWPRPVTGQIRSLAVLPLANLSGDSLESWYADGLTEALTTDLGRLRVVRVVSREAAARYQGKRLPDIARALEVDAVVEGGLQASRGRVRVDLRLVDATSGYQLWADRFEEPADNRFALEDRAASGIMSALKLPLSPAEQRGIRAPPTQNFQAYDFYLRGRIRVRHESRQDNPVAIGLFERAVALDPDFAAAYAELSHAYALRVQQLVREDTVALERAQVAAEKALRLDPDLAEGHYARAFLLWGPGGRFSHHLAVQEDRRALALNPNLAEAHHHLGMVFLHLGLLDSAVAELRQTLAIDPGHRFAQERVGIALLYEGRFAEALRTFEQVPPEFNPALWSHRKAVALLYLDRDSEASSLIDDYLRNNPQDPGGLVTSERAVLFAKRGDTRRAEADIQTAVTKGEGFIHFHHAAFSIATAYALLHRPGPAVRFLRRAAAEGLPCYPCVANDPYLANIRDDRGFVALMRDLKAQWERYRAAL
jgi:DNA-binding SARP family transcriptional activator/TolB-like protein/lipoprotein NlpI